eukprot:Hpha_TRINITY_DN16412_c0_g5::TRINITY_DN16412_c0_g5_i2::g.158896::m.158896
MGEVEGGDIMEQVMGLCHGLLDGLWVMAKGVWDSANTDGDLAVFIFAIMVLIFSVHLLLGAKTPLMRLVATLLTGALAILLVWPLSFWNVVLPGVGASIVLFFTVSEDWRSATGEWATLCGAMLVGSMGATLAEDTPFTGMRSVMAICSCAGMFAMVWMLAYLEHNRLVHNDVVRSWEKQTATGTFHPPLVVFEISKLVSSLRFGKMWWWRELSGSNGVTRQKLYRLLKEASTDDLECWLCRVSAPEVVFFLRPHELLEALGRTSSSRIMGLHPLAKAALVDAFSKAGRLRDEQVRVWTAGLICSTGIVDKPKKGTNGSSRGRSTRKKPTEHPVAAGGTTSPRADGDMDRADTSTLSVVDSCLEPPEPSTAQLSDEVQDLLGKVFLTEQSMANPIQWPGVRERLGRELKKYKDELGRKEAQLNKIEAANRNKAENVAAFKAACDGGGTVHTLHDLVFTRLGQRQRAGVLAHFRSQAEKLVGKPRGVKVLSDLDDTILCSGGRWPAGSDRRLRHGALYPGSLAFVREISNCDGGQDRCGPVFLSARPHLYKDYVESTSYTLFRGLVDAGLLNNMATLLPGQLRPPARDAWSWLTRKGSRPWSNVGDFKAKTLREYAQLYPESRLVLVGDDGQGDRYAGESLVAPSPTALPQLEAVFIHSVLQDEALKAQRYGGGCPSRVHLFSTYIGAANIALQNRVCGFTAENARRVAESAIREMNTMRMMNPDKLYAGYIDLMHGDLADLNATLRSCGNRGIDPQLELN